MADIRINALATTAASTASDDFIAVDGSANGTRKLNAYSPTFGGNLTVSGGKVLISYPSSSQARVSFGGAHFDANSSYASYIRGYSSGANTAGLDFYTTYGSSVLALSLSEQGNATLAGNLTVSGTGTSSVGGSFGIGTTTPTTINGVANAYQQVANVTGSGTCALNITGTQAILSLVDSNASANLKWSNLVNSNGVSTLVVLNDAGSQTQTGFQFFHSTGNFLFGTGSDGGQKLQVNGDSGFLGHLEIPADKHIYMKQSNPLRWSSDGLSTGSVRADVYADSGGALYLRTNGSNTALTLDSSQNATFANAIKLGAGKVVYLDGGVNTYIQGSSGTLFLGTNGASSLSIDSSQNATFAGTVYAGASSNIGWNGRAYLSALADGKVQVTNWANNGTSMLVLGAAASTSYPMLKRNGTGIDVRLADDSAFATFRALDFSAQGAATTVGANQVSYGGTTATTATAGAQTLPANPVGFIIVNVAGTTAKIPYYAN